jgi:hypothetical protein
MFSGMGTNLPNKTIFPYVPCIFLVAQLAVLLDFTVADAATVNDSTSVPAANPSISAAESTTSALIEEVIILGSPSLIRVPNPWPWGEIASPCATFRVSGIPSLATIDLYASGLGHAVLAEIAGDQGTQCPDSSQLHDRITLKRPDSATAIDRFVTLRVDSGPLSTPGTSIQGTVVALFGTTKVGGFALRVERPPSGELATAITWVLSIFIPALITFLIGQAVVTLGVWQKEKTDFRDYRITNMTKIIEFFTSVDTVIRSPQDHPGQSIYAFLVARDIFSKMPRREARRLSAACVADDLAAIVHTLKALFLEFNEPIAKLERSLKESQKSQPL